MLFNIFQCFPTKKYYWKGYIFGHKTYPDFSKCMVQEEHEYINSLLRFSKYSITRACGKIGCGRFDTPSMRWRSWSGIFPPVFLTNKWWKIIVTSSLGAENDWILWSKRQLKEAGLSRIQYAENSVFCATYTFGTTWYQSIHMHIFHGA